MGLLCIATHHEPFTDTGDELLREISRRLHRQTLSSDIGHSTVQNTMAGIVLPLRIKQFWFFFP